MKPSKTIFLMITLLLICWHVVYAQEDTPLNQLRREDLLSRFEELINDDGSNQEVIEELLLEEQEKTQQKGKLNVNALTQEMALDYLHLTDYQYYKLMSYLSEYGEMVSLYELNAVEGFSFEDLQRLKPLLEVESNGRKHDFFKNFFRKSKNNLLLRYGQVLEKQAGYDKSLPKHYLGSPIRLAFKYRFSTQDKLELAVSGEKDAGEQFFRGAQKYGFDYYSGYICLKNIGVLKKAIVGDFKLDLGQGLLMGSALMSGKGGGVGDVRRFAGMIKPSASLNESASLRGVAATIGNYHYTATVFAAYRQYDGNVSYGEDSTLTFEGSLSNSGYHRTEAEQDKSKNMKSYVFGGDFLYRHRVFRIGARAFYTLFDAYVRPADRVYQKYAFTGKGMLNAGVDYQLILKKVILFGELGVSGNGGWAFMQGVTMALSPGASFAFVGHYYDRNYVALQGASFSSSPGEWGLYFTSQVQLTPKLDLSFYYDYTKCTWLRYRVDRPGNTMLAGVNLRFIINRKSCVSLRMQYKRNQKNVAGEAHVNEVASCNSSKIRLIGEFRPLDFLALKTEASYLVNYSKTLAYRRDGLLLYQDVGMDVKRTGLGFHLRVAFFDTDTYDERLYAYENDLYYSFTINSHYDKGCRVYLLVNYTYKCFHLWVKLSQTRFLNKEEVGSGMDLIGKSHKTELKLQLMVKW